MGPKVARDFEDHEIMPGKIICTQQALILPAGSCASNVRVAFGMYDVGSLIVS